MKQLCLLLCVYYMHYAIEAINIKCEGVNACLLSRNFKQIHYNAGYWTKKILYSNTTTSKDPHPVAFIYEDKPMYTYWLMNNETLTSHSYSMSITEGPRGVLLEDIVYYKNKYNTDDQKAVFQSKKKYQSGIVKLIDFYYELKKKTTHKMQRIDFALIYEAEKGEYRIFQTCDKKYAWVQIKHEVLEKLIEGNVDKAENDNADGISIVYPLNRQDQTIIDTLRRIGMTDYKIIDVADKLGFNAFSYIFSRIDTVLKNQGGPVPSNNTSSSIILHRQPLIA